MSKIFRSTSRTNNQNANAHKAEEKYLAADAVDRIARRTPALFRTNRVPRVTTRTINFNDLQAGGVG